jgi:flagellar hook assembly protein FlgD
VFSTIDNGKSWRRLFDAANSITTNPHDRRVIYLGTDYGIVKLADTSATHVTQNWEEQVSGYELYQNYPNPFVTSTQFEYSTPKQTVVKLTIYDLLGRVVVTLFNESKQAGIYEIAWDGKNSDGDEVLPGIYFYRLEAERFTRTKKMFLVR